MTHRSPEIFAFILRDELFPILLLWNECRSTIVLVLLLTQFWAALNVNAMVVVVVDFIVGGAAIDLDGCGHQCLTTTAAAIHPLLLINIAVAIAD